MGASVSKYIRIILLIFLLFSIIFTFIQPVIGEESDIVVEFFYEEDCGHCQEKEPLIDEIGKYYNDNITLLKLSISIPENRQRWAENFRNTPGLIVTNQSNGKQNVFPYAAMTEENLKNIIDYHLMGNYSQELQESDQGVFIDTPFGKVNLSQMSLPVITIILGALDSINPCSFFILLFLLNLLIYVKSRKRMMIIGGIFIFFSGFIYFLLMALLLTTFSVIEQPLIVTFFAGIVALILGVINIKDYFFFKQGVSLSISEDKKQKLFKRMRSIVKIRHLPTMIFATIVLAIFANTYELACTLALPVVYTDFLTNIYNIPLMESYLYLILYNLIYVIPLIIIVLLFVVTLGRRKLTEYQGRILKLVSGVMMFSFGLIMIFSPSSLKNVFIAISILIISIISTILINFIWKYFGKNN